MELRDRMFASLGAITNNTKKKDTRYKAKEDNVIKCLNIIKAHRIFWYKNALKTKVKKINKINLAVSLQLTFVILVVKVPEMITRRKILRQSSVKLTTVIMLCNN